MWTMSKEPINDGRRFEFQFYKLLEMQLEIILILEPKAEPKPFKTWQL